MILLRKFSHWFCLLALLCASDVHLAALQGIAWTTMIVEYSQDSGDVSEGLRRTLSGDEPCSLCSVVQTAVDEEEDTSALPTFAPELLSFIATSGTDLYTPMSARGGWVYSSDLLPDARSVEIISPPS